MLRGEIPPQVFNDRRALFLRGLISCRVHLSPGIFHTGHFYRQAFALGLSSATLFGVVSRFVPRSIAIGETFCVDACATVLDGPCELARLW